MFLSVILIANFWPLFQYNMKTSQSPFHLNYGSRFSRLHQHYPKYQILDDYIPLPTKIFENRSDCNTYTDRHSGERTDLVMEDLKS